MYGLNPRLNVSQLAARFRQAGRLHIADFLNGDSAQRLHDMLRTRQDWVQVINSGDRVFELDRDARAAMTPDQTQAMEGAVRAGARYGFQHRYEAIRVPDDDVARAASADPMAAFARWLSGGEVREFLRAVTGCPDIMFADAQGTAYAPGDFLTGHDDAVAGKDRRAAYVFGLTPVWRPEWGGLLLFHADNASGVEGFSPAFNALNLFRVPQLHSVSEVTQSAAYRRYSITGWLRASGSAA